MRAGLTGGKGVLGARIHAALAQGGHDVSLFAGDVRDLAALRSWCRDLDCVVHAAAIVPVRAVQEALGDAIAVNVGGTANVANAVSEIGGCRLIYISTSHVYRSSDAALEEGGALAPISAYGLTKLQGEQWVQRLVADPLIIRIFSFFDIRQPSEYLVPALQKRVQAAEPGAELVLEGSENIRDIADATWMGGTCAGLIEAGAAGIINCGTGAAMKVADIAQTLSRAMGRTDVHWLGRQNGPVSTLVAHTGRLRGILPDMPAFDLGASVTRFAAEKAAGPAH
jgi:nucleoside-diphosphate-sugar epimerase